MKSYILQELSIKIQIIINYLFLFPDTLLSNSLSSVMGGTLGVGLVSPGVSLDLNKNASQLTPVTTPQTPNLQQAFKPKVFFFVCKRVKIVFFLLIFAGISLFVFVILKNIINTKCDDV